VFVALGIQHAMRMRHIIVCGLPDPKMFFHIISQTAQFSKKNLLNMKYVFPFYLQILSETFLIPERNKRDMIKMYIGLHVKYLLFLPDFNKTRIFSTDFRKILKYKISLKSAQWEPSCSMRTNGRTDRQTDMAKLYNRFSKFCEGA
jgi:hypothetical protein